MKAHNDGGAPKRPQRRVLIYPIMSAVRGSYLLTPIRDPSAVEVATLWVVECHVFCTLLAAHNTGMLNRLRRHRAATVAARGCVQQKCPCCDVHTKYVPTRKTLQSPHTPLLCGSQQHGRSGWGASRVCFYSTGFRAAHLCAIFFVFLVNKTHLVAVGVQSLATSTYEVILHHGRSSGFRAKSRRRYTVV